MDLHLFSVWIHHLAIVLRQLEQRAVLGEVAELRLARLARHGVVDARAELRDGEPLRCNPEGLGWRRLELHWRSEKEGGVELVGVAI